jgi:hypothetical protein
MVSAARDSAKGGCRELDCARARAGGRRRVDRGRRFRTPVPSPRGSRKAAAWKSTRMPPPCLNHKYCARRGARVRPADRKRLRVLPMRRLGHLSRRMPVVSHTRSRKSTRCATTRRQPSSGSIGPGAPAMRASCTSFTAPSSCATRTIRASPRSAGRLACPCHGDARQQTRSARLCRTPSLEDLACRSVTAIGNMEIGERLAASGPGAEVRLEGASALGLFISAGYIYTP